jgi:orotidine-5'-phosphate decarboxylase
MQKILERLSKEAKENKTILCFGIDPSIEKIAGGTGRQGNSGEQIENFYAELVDALLEERQIAAIKPNYAYFAQYGFEGLNALKKLITRYKNRTFIILDAKRGDIAKTNEAYANEAYGFWGGDAVTVSPYAGFDSIPPFIKEGKIQELKIGKKMLYEIIAERSVKMGYGLVVGATSDAIKRIVKITGNKIPLLIPGVGAQGGDLGMVLKAVKSNLGIHRINASSSIAFAYEKHKLTAKNSALMETKKLNDVIGKHF